MVDQTSLKIGKLEASLEGLQELVRQQSEASRESRTRIYGKLEEISASQHDMKSRLEDLETRITKIEPVIAEAASVKQQAIGAARLLKFQWAMFGGLIVGAATWAWTHLVGKHP